MGFPFAPKRAAQPPVIESMWPEPDWVAVANDFGLPAASCARALREREVAAAIDHAGSGRLGRHLASGPQRPSRFPWFTGKKSRLRAASIAARKEAEHLLHNPMLAEARLSCAALPSAIENKAALYAVTGMAADLSCLEVSREPSGTLAIRLAPPWNQTFHLPLLVLGTSSPQSLAAVWARRGEETLHRAHTLTARQRGLHIGVARLRGHATYNAMLSRIPPATTSGRTLSPPIVLRSFDAFPEANRWLYAHGLSFLLDAIALRDGIADGGASSACRVGQPHTDLMRAATRLLQPSGRDATKGASDSVFRRDTAAALCDLARTLRMSPASLAMNGRVRFGDWQDNADAKMSGNAVFDPSCQTIRVRAAGQGTLAQAWYLAAEAALSAGGGGRLPDESLALAEAIEQQGHYASRCHAFAALTDAGWHDPAGVRARLFAGFAARCLLALNIRSPMLARPPFANLATNRFVEHAMPYPTPPEVHHFTPCLERLFVAFRNVGGLQQQDALTLAHPRADAPRNPLSANADRHRADGVCKGVSASIVPAL